MAIKGLSIPAMADYSYDGNKAKYTNGFICGSAVEYGVDIETTDDNHLRADNRIKEHDYGTFNSGTLTLNTSDLDAYTSKRLLGLKEVKRQIGEKTVTELVYDDDAKTKEKGFGIIEEHQIDDVDHYRAVILAKITPKIPPEAATTREDEIEWQTKELECGIERSDESNETYKHPWKFEAWFSSESEALEYIKTILNVMNRVVAKSEEGTTTGKTKITVENAAGNTYKYSTTGPEPTYKQDLQSWTELNMGEEIEAQNGSTLYVAQVDSEGKAIGFGTVTVKAKGE